MDIKDEKDLIKRVKNIENMLIELKQKHNNSEEWIFESEAMQLTGYAKDTLQKFRAAGKLIWRSSPGGRKVEYLKSSIDNFKVKNI